MLSILTFILKVFVEAVFGLTMGFLILSIAIPVFMLVREFLIEQERKEFARAWEEYKSTHAEEF